MVAFAAAAAFPELIFMEDRAAETLAAYGSDELRPDARPSADSTLFGLASMLPEISISMVLGLFLEYTGRCWLTNFSSTGDFKWDLVINRSATFHAFLHDFGAVFTGHQMIAGFEQDSSLSFRAHHTILQLQNQNEVENIIVILVVIMYLFLLIHVFLANETFFDTFGTKVADRYMGTG